MPDTSTSTPEMERLMAALAAAQATIEHLRTQLAALQPPF